MSLTHCFVLLSMNLALSLFNISVYLRINFEKTDVTWIGEQEVDLHVVLNGNHTKQVDSFGVLGLIYDAGGSSNEVQRRFSKKNR